MSLAAVSWITVLRLIEIGGPFVSFRAHLGRKRRSASGMEDCGAHVTNASGFLFGTFASFVR